MAKTKQPVTALAKKGSTAMAPWMQDLANEAKADAAKFRQGVQRISFKGGNIQIDGAPVTGNKLTVVIVEAVFGKAYYEGDYDPSTPQTPVCYAFHPDDQNKMAPHEACPDKQADSCPGCPHNKFGTAERGNGKRCKDEVRIMCAVRTDDPDALVKGEFRMASIPPGSLKNWGNYVKTLRDTGLTFRAVWTEIGVEPLKGAYALTFKSVKPLESEALYLAVKGRREASRDEMMQPYPTLEVEEKPKKGKNKKIV